MKRNLIVSTLLSISFIILPGLANKTEIEAGERPRLAKGVLLVADSMIKGPYFKKTVILITRYGDKSGATGLIINRPTSLKVEEILSHPERLEGIDEKLYFGGPVKIQTPSLLLNSLGPPEGAEEIFGNLYLSHDISVLSRMKNIKKDYNMRLYAGFASWREGQLEGEIMRGGWHIARPTADMIFSKESGETLWEQLFDETGGAFPIPIEV